MTTVINQRTKQILTVVEDDKNKSDRSVTVAKGSHLRMPDLWLDVYIEGNEFEQKMFAPLFASAYCSKASSPSEADLVVFTGGADINPSIYGQEKHPDVTFNRDRDERDTALFQQCYEEGIPMLGVCRGAQLGHALLGYPLYQDVDGHEWGDHGMYDPVNKRYLKNISSSHHQMVVENDRMEVYGYSSGTSKKRYVSHDTFEEGSHKDVEAFFYRDVCFFGVQGHPEYTGFDEFAHWTLMRIEDFVNHNPDVVLTGKYRRLKPEIIAKRDKLKESK